LGHPETREPELPNPADGFFGQEPKLGERPKAEAESTWVQGATKRPRVVPKEEKKRREMDSHEQSYSSLPVGGDQARTRGKCDSKLRGRERDAKVK